MEVDTTRDWEDYSLRMRSFLTAHRVIGAMFRLAPIVALLANGCAANTGTTGTGGAAGGGAGGVACTPAEAECAGPAECCSGACSEGLCSACLGNGKDCVAPMDCCSGICGANGCEACRPAGVPCAADAECCSPLHCKEGVCELCRMSGEACSATSDCCESMECQGGTYCCKMLGVQCSNAADCCAGWCYTKDKLLPECCVGGNGQCSLSGQCCGDEICGSQGKCCMPEGGPCGAQAPTGSVCCPGLGLTCNNGLCGKL
ncbi:MAG: hypothetical protein IPK82_34870 [Polyangiaceae bacterium]|nr:hypothetical protein [Polyangiaceae bacterium]